MTIESVGSDHLNRPLYLARVPAFGGWPARLQPIESPFVVAVVASATDVSAGEIDDFAEALLEQGAAYVCAWGPDCERVHDIFDEAFVGSEGLGREQFVMTTWHDGEVLEEALWYAVWAAAVPDDSSSPAGAVLFVVIEQDAEWATAVRAWVDRGAGRDG